MKIIRIILAFIAVSLCFTSCLEHGLEDLPTYEGNDITAGNAYYRYIDTSDSIPGSGQPKVKQKELRRSAQNINTEAGTCVLEFSIPTNFSNEERAGVSLDSLVLTINVSTAAEVTPVGDAPKLGVPADWTQPHQYSVRAANGQTKIWTITVSLIK